MAERKFAKTYATIIPVITIAAFCLMASAANAQTPAQDEANVTADKQAVEDAQHTMEKDALQMNVDTASRNTEAVQADTAALAADKQAQSDANDKLKTDMQQLTSDDQYFNGTPAPAAPAQPPQSGRSSAQAPAGTSTGGAAPPAPSGAPGIAPAPGVGTPAPTPAP